MTIADDLKVIGDKIAGLTLLQAVQLSQYLEEAHGIKAAAGGGMMMAMPVAAAPAEEAEAAPVKTTFDVVLTNAGGNKIQVIKVVRAATGLGLKEAKDLVDAAPKAIKAGLNQEEAEKLKKELEDSGATVELK